MIDAIVSRTRELMRSTFSTARVRIAQSGPPIYRQCGGNRGLVELLAATLTFKRLPTSTYGPAEALGSQDSSKWQATRRGAERLSVFIAPLGWSRAAYVEFIDDEQLETLACYEHAFE